MDLSNLPSTDSLARSLAPEFDLPRPVIVHACRTAIEAARRSGTDGGIDPVTTARAALNDISAARPRSVVNATGVLLHTNLGRAMIAAEAADAERAVAVAASNTEMDVRTGRRSSRNTYLSELLALVTGAEAGFAVNNNAGALLLAVAAMGGGGRIAVSRGELVEIGGSFRLPELMAAAGVELIEVGTTNRTRIDDFARVAGSVDALLKVHPSNYRIDGFHEDVDDRDMADLARETGVPFIFDVGSGLLDANAPWLAQGGPASPPPWLADEPGVRQAIEHGADLVLFSGDKLLGGPQAGIIVGTADAVATTARHPIARAVRIDGPRSAGVATTLEMYLEQRVLDLPFWAMAAATVDAIGSRARAVAIGIRSVSVIDGESVPGAGSVPGATISTQLIRIAGNEDDIWSRLASCDPPVIGTRRDGFVHLDLRSVLPTDDGHVRAALLSALT
jgi:L-seryl-tRNA(Ser) seleniumtransferase